MNPIAHLRIKFYLFNANITIGFLNYLDNKKEFCHECKANVWIAGPEEIQ